MRVARVVVTLTTLLLAPACMVDAPDEASHQGAAPGGATIDVSGFEVAAAAPSPAANGSCRAEGDACYVDADCCAGLCNGGECHGACTPGTTAPCYSGPPGTADVGQCHPGVQVCDPYGTGWSACTGEVTPAAESCDSLDSDCDGDLTDGCGTVCTPGSIAACYDGPVGTDGVGTCAAGSRVCSADGSGYGACSGAVTPAAELCGDQLDTDCDGETDETCVCAPGSMIACYDGPDGTENVGVCHGGVATCNALGNGYGPCVGQVLPSPTACGNDATDRDCDGQPDDTCGVGGRIWFDSSGDSTELDDVGDLEPGLGGYTFFLRTTLTGALVGVAVSDDQGNYFLPGVPPGVYYFEVELNPPWRPVVPDVGDDRFDSDYDFTGRSVDFNYLGGHVVDLDLGITSSI